MFTTHEYSPLPRKALNVSARRRMSTVTLLAREPALNSMAVGHVLDVTTPDVALVTSTFWMGKCR